MAVICFLCIYTSSLAFQN